MRARYALPAGHDEVLLDAGQPELPGLRRTVRRVPRRRPRRAARRVPDRRRRLLGRRSARTPARPRPSRTARLFLNLLGKEWLPSDPGRPRPAERRRRPPGWPTSRAGPAGPASPSPGVPRAPRGRLRPGRAVDRAGPGERRRPRRGRPGLVPGARRGRPEPGRPVRSGDRLRDAARSVAAGRGAAGDAAACWPTGGAVIIMDERVAETFTAPGDRPERLYYGFSTLCCLPAGMADQPSAATGTVMRPATLRQYAPRPASRTSRSCRSSTTCSGSTACCPDRPPNGSPLPPLPVRGRGAGGFSFAPSTIRLIVAAPSVPLGSRTLLANPNLVRFAPLCGAYRLGRRRV